MPKQSLSGRILLGSTIFLGAFCLFQVQPLLAKALLPSFGGSAGVWTVCLLFFQLVLLLGYAYAHLSISQLSTRSQGILHITLLCASFVFLPIGTKSSWAQGTGDPLIRLFTLLAATIGLPYLLLASTSPLLQSWFANRDPETEHSAYRLFALSNAGSMLGLLTFPLLLEPRLTIASQAQLWSVAYGIFALLCAREAWLAAGRLRSAADAVKPQPELRTSTRHQILWILLSAAGAALLLAISNHISNNVAPMPLLWIIPLALYLLTFVLCFESKRWYRRSIFIPLSLLATAGMVWGLFGNNGLPYDGDIRLVIALYAAGLFCWCMTLHGEMVRLRPNPSQLTRFYLFVALGGAIGGLLIAWAAPFALSRAWDLLILLAVCPALLLATCWGDIFASASLKKLPRPATVAIAAAALASVAGFSIYLANLTWQQEKDTLFAGRNFYGALTVREHAYKFGQLRQLLHGAITHGEEYLGDSRQRIATTYYWKGAGVGRALSILQKEGPLSIGAIGLGTGTIAAYTRPGDSLKFYEINPLVVDFARNHFNFLKSSPAQPEIHLGDGRLTLEQQPPQNFDILIVDAFSGDAVPVHLLTREALAIYWKNLKPDGVLAIHTSNRHLDLESIVYLGLSSFPHDVRIVIGTEDGPDDGFISTWVLSTSRPGFFQDPLLIQAGQKMNVSPALRLWTDQYSSVLPLIQF